MLFLTIFIHQTHSPNHAAPSMAMLPPPGQEQNNQDRRINTSIFSLTAHLTSTKPPSHDWKCSLLPWGLVNVCCNTRHGPALDCVWHWFPSPGLILTPAHSDVPHPHDEGMSEAGGLLMPWAGAAITRCYYPLQMTNSTSTCAKNAVAIAWWTLEQQQQRAKILFAGFSYSKEILSGPHASLWPELLPHANTLSMLSKLEGTLKPLESSDEQLLPHIARGAWESPCPGMGSTSPAPDWGWWLQPPCCFPSNIIFGREEPHQYTDLCWDW